MSTREQVKVFWRVAGNVSEGCLVASAHERLTVNLQAKYAASLAGSIAATLTLRDINSDEQGSALSPKAIASVACDIAQQLMSQFEERGWLVELPDPIPTRQESAMIAERLSVAGVR